jgi:iron complex transport system ATP-binding protein
MPDQPAIHLDRVGVRRGNRWILRDVSWRVPAGTCAAVLGPNGSGKSTLARGLAGHLWPTTGECRVLGNLFGETDLNELRRSVRMIQPAGPYDIDAELTAREVVLTGFFGTLGLYDFVNDDMNADAERVLRRVGLAGQSEQPYSTMSSGERVRSLIARALVQRPALLLLDEPTAGLDLLAREQVLATVEALFRSNESERPTVLLITHHVEELPPATSQVLMLSDGKVAAQGEPGAVLRSEVLSEVYRCPVEVRRSNGRFYLEVSPTMWEGLIDG